jgi:hypothetical protein
MAQVFRCSSTRSFGPTSQALPIHAKTGREWGPKRLLAYGPQDDEFWWWVKLISKLSLYQRPDW